MQDPQNGERHGFLHGRFEFGRVHDWKRGQGGCRGNRTGGFRGGYRGDMVSTAMMIRTMPGQIATCFERVNLALAEGEPLADGDRVMAISHVGRSRLVKTRNG